MSWKQSVAKKHLTFQYEKFYCRARQETIATQCASEKWFLPKQTFKIQHWTPHCRLVSCMYQPHWYLSAYSVLTKTPAVTEATAFLLSPNSMQSHVGQRKLSKIPAILFTGKLKGLSTKKAQTCINTTVEVWDKLCENPC